MGRPHILKKKKKKINKTKLLFILLFKINSSQKYKPNLPFLP